MSLFNDFDNSDYKYIYNSEFDIKASPLPSQKKAPARPPCPPQFEPEPEPVEELVSLDSFVRYIGFELWENCVHDPAIYIDSVTNIINSANRSETWKISCFQSLHIAIAQCVERDKNIVSRASSFNTLAQGRTDEPKAYISGEYKKVLTNRARAKYFSQNLSVALAELRTDLEKSYRNTYYCGAVIEQKGKKFTSRYCNNRWCVLCNRIRTAKLINGYGSVIKEFKEPYFLTLTQRNCNADSLFDQMHAESEFFRKYFQNRQKSYKRNVMPQFVGIKKTEITHNAKTNEYHPHYHLLVDGRESATHLLRAWLNYWLELDVKFGLQLIEFQRHTIDGNSYSVYQNMRATPKAQDLKLATQNVVDELFKYFTKLITRVDRNRAICATDNTGRELTRVNPYNGKVEPVVIGYKPLVINVLPLDVIFSVMRGKRVYQAINCRKVQEDIEELQSEIDEGALFQNCTWTWNSEIFDWQNDSGEKLSEYEVSAAMRSIAFISQ